MLTLHPPHIRLATALLFASAVAPAQARILQNSSAPIRTPAMTSASPDVLAAFQVSRATVQELAVPQKATPGFEVDVHFGARTYRLRLQEHDVRAPNFQLVVHDQNGMRVVPTPANTTFQGVVAGVRDSLVSASLSGGQLQAHVHFGTTSTWIVQPVSRVVPNAPQTSHIVYDQSASVVPNAKCGVTATDTPQLPNVAYSSGANSICEIACDADVEFYRLNGSNITRTQNDVTAVINNVDAIYQRDVQIEYEITTIIVRTFSIYSTNNSSALLSQFGNYWFNNHRNVVRDVAHLFTGRNLNGGTIGIAFLATICTASGYGLSQSRWTNNSAYRTGLTAHELGHNWGSNHCSGSGCYIMCPGLGGCGRNLSTFSSGSRNAITNHAASRGCLSVAAPTLTSVTPFRVQAFEGGTITLRGSGFDSATRVNVGTTALPKGTGTNKFTVVSDSVITFPAPRPSTIGPVLVTVGHSGGTSNGVGLIYEPTTPPKLSVPTSITRNSFLVWQFGGVPDHQYFVTVAGTSTTAKVLGFDWLLNSVVIANGKLDAVGYGFLFVQVPQSVGVGLKVSSQVVTIDRVMNAISGTTNVISTTIR